MMLDKIVDRTYYWVDEKARATSLALSLILGGAAGNLIDRLVYGYVIDFIDVYYQSYHWPAFNIADSAIVAGGIMLLIDGFFFSSIPVCCVSFSLRSTSQ